MQICFKKKKFNGHLKPGQKTIRTYIRFNANKSIRHIYVIRTLINILRVCVCVNV